MSGWERSSLSESMVVNLGKPKNRSSNYTVVGS